MKQEKSDQTDEGYVEQKFEEPDFMKDWSDERKAEFAYQLLLCIPVSKTIKVVDRLSPLLHKDYISSLPNEIIIQILYYLDITSLTRMSRLSKRWKKLSEDQSLWKSLFFSAGWTVNKASIQHYLSDPPSRQEEKLKPYASTSACQITSVPLSRSTALHDLHPSPSTSGNSILARLKPFKKDTSTDPFVSRYQPIYSNSHSANNSNYNSTTTSATNSNSNSSSTSNLNDHHNTNTDITSPNLNNVVIHLNDLNINQQDDQNPEPTSPIRSRFLMPRVNGVDPIQSRLVTYRFNGNNSMVIRPTHVHSSRSQPILRYLSKNKPEVLSHTILERPPTNRPSSRKKYDEAATYHYREFQDERYINWKRLYRNRNLIQTRWQDGKYKLRPFPNPNDYGLIEHNSGIYCLQFDTKVLVIGSRDRNIKIWDIQSGRLRHTLEGHKGSVLCLQFDDRYLISGSSDSTLICWDSQTGKKIKTLTGHHESVLNVKFKEGLVVSCSKDRTIRTWDLESGTCLRILRGHRAAVNAVQFKGNRIVSASGDRTIKIWDLETGECLNTLDSHSRGIACVEYDGQYIVSGSSDHTIKVWNASTGECIHTLIGHEDLVRTLQLDSKTKTIVSGSYDGTLRIWKLDDLSKVKKIDQTSHGRILNLQFDFSKIICCSNLGKIDMYDFTHGMDTQFLL